MTPDKCEFSVFTVYDHSFSVVMFDGRYKFLHAANLGRDLKRVGVVDNKLIVFFKPMLLTTKVIKNARILTSRQDHQS